MAMNPWQTTGTGPVASYVVGGTGKRRSPSKKKGQGKTYYNILDLLADQSRRFKPGQTTKKSHNVNPREHMAHRDKTKSLIAELAPVPDGSGLQIPTMGSVADFLGMAGSLVNPQYDAAIKAIRDAQAAAQGRANTNRGILGEMFNQLSGYYTTDAQRAAGDIYTQAKQASTANTKDARDSIAGTYTDMQVGQREEAERLGIEGMGLEEEMAEQNTDRAFVESLMAKDAAAQQNYLTSGESSLKGFNQSSSNVAKLEGSERQADLMRALEDYMAESGAQIGTLEGERAGSLQEIALELAQRDFQNKMAQYEAQVGQEDRIWDREMQMMELEAAMAAAQQEAAQARRKSETDFDDPWSKVASFAERVQPGFGKNIMAVLMQNMNDDDLQKMLQNPAVPMNPAAFARYFNSQNRRGTGAESSALNQTAQYLYNLLYGKS